jgi:hypothetical protein
MATGILEQRGVGVAGAATIVPDERRRWRPSGEAVAALLAAMVGMLTLALVNQLTELSAGFTAWVHSIGKLWMPGAPGIGPYSGKETLSAAAWLVSWAILHPALRARELNLSRWLLVFLLGVAVATTFIWPPVYGHVGAFLSGH